MLSYLVYAKGIIYLFLYLYLLLIDNISSMVEMLISLDSAIKNIHNKPPQCGTVAGTDCTVCLNHTDHVYREIHILICTMYG